jgi:hypothetical protein
VVSKDETQEYILLSRKHFIRGKIYDMSAGWNMTIKVDSHLTKILPFFHQLKINAM